MEKQRWEESERRRQEVRRSEKRKSEKTEDAGARQGRKVAIHCVFPMICGPEGSKSRLAKAAGAEPAGQMTAKRMCKSKCTKHLSVGALLEVEMSKKWTLLWRGVKHIYKPKCTKHTRFGTFLEVEMSKVPAAISDHFWKLRCRKSARPCGASTFPKVSKT